MTNHLNGIRHMRIKVYAATQVAVTLLLVGGFVWMVLSGQEIDAAYTALVGLVLNFFFDSGRRSEDNQASPSDVPTP